MEVSMLALFPHDKLNRGLCYSKLVESFQKRQPSDSVDWCGPNKARVAQIVEAGRCEHQKQHRWVRLLAGAKRSAQLSLGQFRHEVISDEEIAEELRVSFSVSAGPLPPTPAHLGGTEEGTDSVPTRTDKDTSATPICGSVNMRRLALSVSQEEVRRFLDSACECAGSAGSAVQIENIRRAPSRRDTTRSSSLNHTHRDAASTTRSVVDTDHPMVGRVVCVPPSGDVKNGNPKWRHGMVCGYVLQNGCRKFPMHFDDGVVDTLTEAELNRRIVSSSLASGPSLVRQTEEGGDLVSPGSSRCQAGQEEAVESPEGGQRSWENPDGKPAGSLVWYRFSRFWIPGRICDPEDSDPEVPVHESVLSSRKAEHNLVLSLDDLQYAWVRDSSICDFRGGYARHSAKCMKTARGYKAIQRTLEELQWKSNPDWHGPAEFDSGIDGKAKTRKATQSPRTLRSRKRKKHQRGGPRGRPRLKRKTEEVEDVTEPELATAEAGVEEPEEAGDDGGEGDGTGDTAAAGGDEVEAETCLAGEGEDSMGNQDAEAGEDANEGESTTMEA